MNELNELLKPFKEIWDNYHNDFEEQENILIEKNLILINGNLKLLNDHNAKIKKNCNDTDCMYSDCIGCHIHQTEEDYNIFEKQRKELTECQKILSNVKKLFYP